MADTRSKPSERLQSKIQAAQDMHRVLGLINELIAGPTLQEKVVGKSLRNKLVTARRLVQRAIYMWSKT